LGKIISSKRTSTILLAIVLVVGTISLIYPSIIVGAQAQSIYLSEEEYYNLIEEIKRWWTNFITRTL
jgi:hypothetical protein